ncbi:MAG TPA: hypothetical protein VKR06_20230 [Ktedonosporobacter sp.]|nr:hypothetical protein [Ktedonosporobacter sp.]
MKHPQPELLMMVCVTPNEVIAMNAAAGFYRTYGRQLTPHHQLFCLLLEQYLHRLYIQVQQKQQGGNAW